MNNTSDFGLQYISSPRLALRLCFSTNAVCPLIGIPVVRIFTDHFRMDSRKFYILYLGSNVTVMYSNRSSWHQFSIDSVNGFPMNRRQTIPHFFQLMWCYMTSVSILFWPKIYRSTTIVINLSKSIVKTIVPFDEYIINIHRESKASCLYTNVAPVWWTDQCPHDGRLTRLTLPFLEELKSI